MHHTHPVIFKIGIAIENNEITKSDGIKLLIKETHMNQGSAQMILGQIFPRFINGERFTRTLNVQLFDDLLYMALENQGIERLKICLNALQQHIDYIKTKGDAKIKLRRVFNKYNDLLSELTIKEIIHDEKEQNEIVDFYTKGKTRDELIIELLKSKNFEDGEVTINIKKYKRNNKIVALIKLLRNFECQICQKFILKKDGSKYVEAAHINPKHKKGKELEENIILLCPNHHKEFDYGYRQIIKHSNEEVEFILNGINYKINLTIS